MARFESKIQGGFYPTDDRWLPYIANLFKPASTRGKLLDPFAGMGDALKYLSDSWNLEPFAIEIDQDRGRECQKKFGVTNAIIDDYYNTTISNFSFPIVYINPPYDTDMQGNVLYGNRRAEYRALQQSWKYLQPDGYLCYVIYTQHMTPAVFESLANNSTMIHVYRFPELHLEKYQQILIVAQFQKKKRKPDEKWIEEKTNEFIALASQPQKIRDITKGAIPRKALITNSSGDTVDEVIRGPYQIPTQKTLKRFWFIPRKMDGKALTELNTMFGAHKDSEFAKLVAPLEKPLPIRPIAQPRYGQLAVIIAAGLLDGVIIKHEGKNAILRGSVQRMNVKVKSETDEDSNGHERITDTFHDKPMSAIIVLCEDGSVFNITEHDKLVQFISDHRTELLEYFDANYNPAYDMTINSFWGETYDSYKVRGKYPLLPTQEQVGTALTEHLLRNDYAILVGEPSFGKTPVATSIIINLRKAQLQIQKEYNQKHAKDKTPEMIAAEEHRLGFMAERYGKSKLKGIDPGKPVIILCPAIMPQQWQEEVNAMYPEAEFRILTDITSTRTLFEDAKANKNKLYIGAISYETAKLGEAWKGSSFVTRRYSKETERLRDGTIIRNIAVDKYALEPVTGSAYMEKRNKNTPAKMVHPSRMDAKMIFYEGKIFDGYEDSIDGSGTKTRRPKYIHVVNRRVTEAEEAQGFRQMSLPMFSWSRRWGLPKVGNGHVMFHEEEVTLAPRKTYTLKKGMYLGFQKGYEYILKEGETKERQIIKKVYDGPIYPEEEILDEWLAMQGIRCTMSSKRRNPIDERMMALKKTVYKFGGGDMKLDEALRKLGVSTYYLGFGEVVPRPPRFPIAEYIAERYNGQVGLLIVDEIHKCKGIDTDRGIASRILIQASKKVLGLTGTLYGGVASSIYAIEFIFNKRVQKRFPWINGFPIHWVGVMGTIEEQWRTQASYSNGSFTGYKRVQTTTGKEAPGCSPLLVRELMDHCVFVGLKDLGGVMPDFSEIPEEVEMDSVMKSVYDSVYHKLTDYNKKCIIGGDGSFTASMYQNILRLPDSMHRENTVHHRPRLDKYDVKSKRQDIIVMVTPSIGDYVKPKENRLGDMVKAKIDAGKRVIIYVSQTGTRDIQDRIQDIIKAKAPNARPFILRNVGTLNRVRWIQNQVDLGGNVMICNPGLVTEGVNLIMFSTIIYIEIEPSLTVMTQSSRRCWRLSQPEKEVEVDYLYYNDIYQSGLLFSIADKTAAANVLYGHEGGTLSGLSETVEVFDDIKKIVEDAKAISREAIAEKFNSAAYNASVDFTQSSWFAPFRREPEWYFGEKRKAEDFVEAMDGGEEEDVKNKSEEVQQELPELGGEVDFDFNIFDEI